MTVASFLLAGFIIYQFTFQKSSERRISNFFAALVFFELFANAGKISDIAGMEVLYSDILWAILGIYSFSYLITNPINQSVFIRNGIFLTVLITSLFSEAFFPYSEVFSTRSILIAIRFLLMIAVYRSVGMNFSETEREYILKIMVVFQKVTYIVVCIEMVIKLFFDSSLYFGLINFLLGVSANQVNWLVIRGGIPAFQALCKEPSHLAICLFFSCLIDLWLMERKKINSMFFIINCLLLLLSGSFSSILFVPVLILAYLVIMKISSKRIIFVALILAMIPVAILALDKTGLAQYYMERLSNALSLIKSRNFDIYSSEGVRLGSMFSSLDLFKNRPFLGIGLGNNVSTCAFPALLSTMGILGVLAYIFAFVDSEKTMITFIFVLLGTIFAMDEGVFYSIHLMLFFVIYGSDPDLEEICES